MKVTLALLSAAVVVSASSHNHRHAHRHLHKVRKADNVVVVPEIVDAFVLNGVPISQLEVEEGIRNGTLQITDDAPVTTSVATTTSAAPTTSTTAAPTSTSTSSTSSTSSQVHSSAPPPAPAAPAPQKSVGSGNNVNTPFPDGQLDCSEFPSQYGAVALDYLGLGGWSGVQKPGSGGLLAGFASILTMDSSTCSGSNCCSEGAFCSYACPDGYQKSQWPSTQGATGQSVGGLACTNGKLHLTNPSLSSNLCMTGASEVNILVENNLGQNVAVCRTDYPGTESETIPTNVEAGCTTNLTCPSADNYYTWKGGKTSAQYYVNPAGIAPSQACNWGSQGNDWGNFAPLNLGVGYSNGMAWLSIFQNAPTTNAQLQFSIDIVGDGVTAKCSYSNGQYCGATGCNSNGCTTSLASGTAKFVFS